MSDITTIDRPAKKAAGKAPKLEADINNEAPQKVLDPLEDLRNQAQAAYSAYLGAQRQVATAYKQREQEEVKAYKQLEKQTQEEYDAAINTALKIRMENEQAAFKAFTEAINQAAKEYEVSVSEALSNCRTKMEQQWQASREVSDQIWDLYQGNGIK